MASLAGKTVGTAGIAYQTAELQTMLRSAGVNPSSVKQVNVGFDLVPAMLSGKVAATVGGFWNYEALQLRLLHRTPVVIPVDQAGVPTYDELVLVVRQDEAQTRGEDIRGFLHALTLGEAAVKADPAGSARLVVAANPSLDPKLQLASIQAALPAAYPASPGQPYGYQNPVDMGGLLELDVLQEPAELRPDERRPAVHERVPAGARRLTTRCAAARPAHSP